MFEPILEEQNDYVCSLIIKGEFGDKVVNNLVSPIGNVDFNILKLEDVTDLSDNVITFVIADNLTEAEWVKIRSATSSNIFVIGCASPVQEPETNSGFICETSPELCIQTLISMIKMISGDGLIMVDFADIRHILTECGKQNRAVYVESTRAEEAVITTLKQLSDKSISLEEISGVLINIIADEQLEVGDIYTIVQALTEKFNEDTTIIFSTSIDMNKQAKELDLNVIVSY